jgi:2-polyprenyl-6-methoxyphenol hydroxylase-like FAD-dependent oxidoreductase
MIKRLDIAIAGAGPGGLATALYLDRLGHRLALFERFETPRPVGSGLMLQPTGQAVLDHLGLLEGARLLGAPIRRLDGADAVSGRTVLAVDLNDVRPGTHAIGIHRAALFGLLHQAVARRGMEIAGGNAVSDLERRDGKSWLVIGHRREGPFDLVIDAMGAASPLRRHAHHPAPPRALPFGAVWATLPWVDNGFDREGLMQRYRRASAMAGVMPIGRLAADSPPLAAFFWSLRTAEYGALMARGLEQWKNAVRRHWPDTAPHLDAIAAFDQLTLARYGHHTLLLPTGHGIAFVGDSAHATSPQLGQGANMALLDAAILASALAEAETIEEALATYARNRRWHVRLHQALSLTLTPLYQSDSLVLPMLRDTLVSVASHLPPIRRLMAAMVTGALCHRDRFGRS